MPGQEQKHAAQQQVVHLPHACACAGCEKAKFSWYKLVMLSILAGAYVGFGYTTALMVGGLMEQAPSNPDQSAGSWLFRFAGCMPHIS